MPQQMHFITACHCKTTHW